MRPLTSPINRLARAPPRWQDFTATVCLAFSTTFPFLFEFRFAFPLEFNSFRQSNPNRHHSCLRGEGGREGERENGWLLLCGTQPQNFGTKTLSLHKIVVILSSNGQEEMSPGTLLLRINVTYNI
jgi:hypothetical protein